MYFSILNAHFNITLEFYFIIKSSISSYTLYVKCISHYYFKVLIYKLKYLQHLLLFPGFFSPLLVTMFCRFACLLCFFNWKSGIVFSKRKMKNFQTILFSSERFSLSSGRQIEWRGEEADYLNLGFHWESVRSYFCSTSQKSSAWIFSLTPCEASEFDRCLEEETGCVWVYSGHKFYHPKLDQVPKSAISSPIFRGGDRIFIPPPANFTLLSTPRDKAVIADYFSYFSFPLRTLNCLVLLVDLVS